jgi:ankyrin repeat protein
MNKNNIDLAFQLVRTNQLDDLKKILDNDNVNSYIDEFKKNLLQQAITSETLDIIKYLLDCKIDVNDADKDGKTPLHYSTAYNNYEVTKLILENNPIEIDKKDVYGNNPLWVATFNARGFYDVVKLLKQYGANPDSKNNSARSALDFAKQIGDEELEQILLK